MIILEMNIYFPETEKSTLMEEKTCYFTNEISLRDTSIIHPKIKDIIVSMQHPAS